MADSEIKYSTQNASRYSIFIDKFVDKYEDIQPMKPGTPIPVHIKSTAVTPKITPKPKIEPPVATKPKKELIPIGTQVIINPTSEYRKQSKNTVGVIVEHTRNDDITGGYADGYYYIVKWEI